MSNLEILKDSINLSKFCTIKFGELLINCREGAKLSRKDLASQLKSFNTEKLLEFDSIDLAKIELDFVDIDKRGYGTDLIDVISKRFNLQFSFVLQVWLQTKISHYVAEANNSQYHLLNRLSKYLP